MQWQARPWPAEDQGHNLIPESDVDGTVMFGKASTSFAHIMYFYGGTEARAVGQSEAANALSSSTWNLDDLHTGPLQHPFHHTLLSSAISPISLRDIGHHALAITNSRPSGAPRYAPPPALKPAIDNPSPQHQPPFHRPSPASHR